MHNKSAPMIQPSAQELGLDMDAVRRRLQMSYPGLTYCLGWLLDGWRVGGEWEPLLDGYARRIGHRHAQVLFHEIEDVRRQGLKSEQGLNTFISLLGWEMTEAPHEVGGSLSLLAQIEATVARVWELGAH